MSTPTLWDIGRWSGGRITRLSITLSVLLAGVDVAATGGLGIVFGVGFLAICGLISIMVRPDDFFRAGVLPPLLILGLCTILGAIRPGAIAHPDDSPLQALISGLAHESDALLAGYLLVLVVLAIRHRRRMSLRSSGGSAKISDSSAV